MSLVEDQSVPVWTALLVWARKPGIVRILVLTNRKARQGSSSAPSTVYWD